MLGWFRKRRYSSPPALAGEPFLFGSRRKHQGGRGFFLWTFLVGGPCGSPPSLPWPAAHNPTSVTARPRLAGWKRMGFVDRKDPSHSQKPSLGRWAGKPGRMRGDLLQRFPCRKGRSPDCLASTRFSITPLGNPVAPHQSPSVNSFPQGEASGLISPTRKSDPKSGRTWARNSPSTGTCATTAETSSGTGGP